MKTYPLLFLTVGAALLPGLTFAAKKGKSGSRHGHHGGASVEALNSYDKNANHRIDADELPLLQKAFSAMRVLDKNADGQINPLEAASVGGDSGRGKRGHMHGQFRKADKNSNRKIDSDEIAELQKSLAGSPTLSRLDRNKNGKLDDNEVDRVNKRLDHGGKRKSGSSTTKTPVPDKAPSALPTIPEKTDEKKTDVDPFLPSAKPSGNIPT